MSKLKTVWDAVNELRGDVESCVYFDLEVPFIGMIYVGTIKNTMNNNALQVTDEAIENDSWSLVCAITEFNALVEDMKTNFGESKSYHNYKVNFEGITTDRLMPPTKETKPDYTSLEFWKDAPDGKDYLITYKSGVAANVLNFFKSKPEIIDGYYRIAGKSIGYGQSSWELFKRPQSTQMEAPKGKEALDSIVNKPLVYTQEFRVTGGDNPRYQPCRVVYSGTKYTVLVNSDGREFSRKTSKLDIRDIDTRTKKEKAIDDIFSNKEVRNCVFSATQEALGYHRVNDDQQEYIETHVSKIMECLPNVLIKSIIAGKVTAVKWVGE